MPSFPFGRQKELHLAVLGMVEGNGHPYSWSAILNGYDAGVMAECPYPVIPGYLARQPLSAFGLPGVRVTHIWTDDPHDADHIARACRIPNVVRHAEAVIGAVDAVLITTDRGHEHIERCRPFVDAGMPIFVDKPLVDSEPDLRVVCEWIERGVPLLSSSSMRYAKEFLPYRLSSASLGELRLITMTMMKSWEAYGIHALEAVYPITGPGYISCRNTGNNERNILHLRHGSGCDVILAVMNDMPMATMQLFGAVTGVTVTLQDMFYGFKAQLEAFIEFLRSGIRPYSFAETIELMKLVIAGIRSRNNGGSEVFLNDILP